ncbi:DUF2274 domain-containing protein [Mesorhizobium mediterraneum]|uniref:DUF2274 domain-containing protein n=1 Tax=Mesorhizobium mediterraneum TaxID=43617 RepID=UPI00177D6BF6|nr:DUF2274 domain-containing protein [Mesorhizobium mediterraneum]
MANLKLGKLPDRTPSKITITVNADLDQSLKDYAALYRETYGESETVAELIPFMLAGFLEGDRVFAKARKEGLPAAGMSEKSRRLPGPGSERD